MAVLLNVLLVKLKKLMVTYIKTTARNLRISPRKLRLVVKTVKNMPLPKLIEYLPLMPQKGAKMVYKTLKTAIADASHNFNLPLEKLTLDQIKVDEGMVLKRWRAVSRGRAHGYKRRRSHLTIVLKEAN